MLAVPSRSSATRDTLCPRSAIPPAGALENDAPLRNAETLMRLTIAYQAGEDGWTVASIQRSPAPTARATRGLRREPTSLMPRGAPWSRAWGEHKLAESVQDAGSLKLVIAA